MPYPINGVPGFKFGADPEVFIHDAEGKLVPAVGLIPGTKEAPHKVEYGAVQVDGLAAEFNIDPVTNFTDFNRNIVQVMRQLKAMLPAGYGFLIQPAVTFDQSIMDALAESDKQMGCDPDFDAWTGQVNPIPDTSDTPGLRTASGHVHVGWCEGADVSNADHIEHCRDLTKQLDYYLGAWSVKLDPDMTRRKLYGKAGAFRPKSYGCEYRVLSNFWLTSRDRRCTVWNRMNQAIEDMRRVFYPDRAEKYYPGANAGVVSFINTGEKPPQLANLGSYPINSLDRYYERVRAA